MEDTHENSDLGGIAEKPVNWVGLRWECTSTRIALALMEQVRADIREFNLHSPARKLEVTGDCSEFEVRDGSGQDGNPVYFALQADQIAIRRHGAREMVVTWLWDRDALACKLSLNGGEAALWRISQSALYEKLFPKG